MISFGALLGKASPAQMLALGFFETIFYHLNIFITIFKLKVHDIGGGMVIHTFGAYFGTLSPNIHN
jgi:ammonium transporter Rh